MTKNKNGIAWPKWLPLRHKYCVSLECLGSWAHARVPFYLSSHFARLLADFTNSAAQYQCHQLARDHTHKKNDADYFLQADGLFQWLIVREICVLICFFRSYIFFEIWLSFVCALSFIHCHHLFHFSRSSDLVCQIFVSFCTESVCMLSFNLIIINEMKWNVWLSILYFVWSLSLAFYHSHSVCLSYLLPSKKLTAKMYVVYQI